SWSHSDNQFVIWDYENPEGAHPEEWIPNAFIGRLPAERISEMEHIVAKILAYEIEPYTGEPWVEGAQLIAQGVRSCIHTNVAVRELMEGFGYDGNNLHEAYADYPNAINVDDALDNISEGLGFVNFRGYNNWGNISQYNISALRNEWKLPVVTGMVCGTNDFAGNWGADSNPSRGEAFVRAWHDDAGTGGVACFGPTDLNTHTWYNNTMDGEFYHTLFNRGVTYLGALCVASKIRLISTYPSNLDLYAGTEVGYYFYTYTLLGDPSMQVRTREPIPIIADYNETYPTGTTSFDIFVCDEDEALIEGAYVHVYLNDEARYGAFTNGEGIASINCDPLEDGEYLVTVSGQNYIPVLGSCAVTPAEAFLALEDVQIDDDANDDSNGNADGIASPGETIELNVTLKNSGTEDSEGANATLSSDSPWINAITRSEVEYNAIASGETAAGNRPFVFNLLPGTPYGVELNFGLHIVSGNNEWEKSFTLITNGYNFNIISFIFADTLLTPGTEQELTIEIKNSGDFNARELNATLYCDDRSVQIREAESFFEAIASGDTSENNRDIPFVVFASPNAYDGSEVSFGLLLVDDSGLSDSLIFTTLLGEPTPDAPQGPDPYGYWAFDNRDTTSGMAPEYNWVDGRNRLNGISDQQDAGDQGSRVYQELPFDFTYYGREYSGITINSNGWMCFGRSDQYSWNNQEMGSGLAPAAMVAPFWEDLYQGSIYTWYDEDNARYIIEWREFGSDFGSMTFEVILYDPTVINTITGDGEIVFQYYTFPRNLRDYPEEDPTIGICSHDRDVKLQIRHARTSDPRTDGLESGMAVRFTTGEFMELGAVSGRVLDIVDHSPMENAWVRIDGTGFFDRTDENGAFKIENVPIGLYTLVASMRHFNDDEALEIEITEDNETIVPDFELTHPIFNIDRERINYGLRPDSSDYVIFNIWNDGNGPLDYTIEIDSRALPPEERDDPWEIMFDYNLSDTARTGNWEVDGDDSSYTGDYNLKGITFDGDYLYVAGAFIRSQQPHLIYVFNKDGERVRQFNQVTLDPDRATWGYGEMEFSGQNIFAIEKDTILEINTDGEVIKTFLNPHSRSASLAWSREDAKMFSKGITARTLTEFDTSGGEPIEHAVPANGTLKVYGMAWYPIDPDGYNLYMFVDNENEDGEPRLQIMKYSIEAEETQHVAFLDYDDSYKPVGCTITKLWNPLLWTMICLVSHADGDRVVGFELGPNLTWIGFDPDSASIPPHENQPVTISFFAEGMPERDYYVLAKVLHNAVGDRHDIDVFFTIDSAWVNDIDDDAILPNEFTFSPPYPNPFNPTTRLSFTLPEPSQVELAVYDLTGRLVHEYDFGRLEVGRHEAMFNGNRLSSGIYFARLKAGSEVITQKMLLLK
ncbi:carboxypeptidase regulatory-like domain-containing protein, partial [bacterium]|nr:carboxypeptidase regulatory-like domain-containing protein [bacterium]